jgi:hypothetical protein
MTFINRAKQDTEHSTPMMRGSEDTGAGTGYVQAAAAAPSSDLKALVQCQVDACMSTLQEDVRNLHIEVLRQTHMQQVDESGFAVNDVAC